MWVEANTLSVSFTYTVSGSAKLPKEGFFAGIGKSSHENTKLIQSLVEIALQHIRWLL
jgi:hypothetical protein